MTSALPPTEWLVDPAIAYLNHGGFGALPRPVADAAAELRGVLEANPTDVLMRRWQGLVDDVRARVATFLGADPAGCVFVPNATTGSATVLERLGLGPGDEVVTTDHRYPAVAEQAAAVAASRGARVVEVPIPLDDDDGQVVDAIAAAVSERTRIVVVDQIASPTGFVFPVADIAAAAHAAGVPVLVDAAHAPGQVHVDLARLDVDFWSGNLHKWVCSPRACAVLVVGERWRDRIRPLVPSHDFRRGFQPAFDWTGTADPIPLLAIPAALDFWDGLGWDAVRREQRALVTAGAREVAARIGTTVPVSDAQTAAIRLVELPRHLAADDERKAFAWRLTTDHKVTAHVTAHQGRTFVRVCGQLYNRPEDYERLADALLQLL